MIHFPALAILLVLYLAKAEPSCTPQCQCPREPPRCAPGVSLLLDGCGCCRVCARQLNQDCSKTLPCDRTRGLECNFGASPSAQRGICRAKSEGRPCEYNSRIYQNGEIFQPNCKHQCTCMDGAVGCLPLCPQELSLPNAGCPNPWLVKVPGQCCEEWTCDRSKAGPEAEGRGGAFSQETVVKSWHDLPLYNNELLSLLKKRFKRLPAWRPKCFVQTTEWSQCSRTCGVGVSTRVTNDNPDCKLRKETRICNLRPCDQVALPDLKKGKKCYRTKKSSSATHFTYAGCTSVKRYRSKHCGSCVDGRCCTPQQTRTVRVRFRCDDGETFTKNMMMIQSCRCHYNCPHHNEASSPYVMLHNDIHKFLD
ncbi:CCN family member 1 [Pristis pectinata]|uniref:CCN family member 1 n=1 Tax=Pristis pectinata TaxID=685728 RepID=UPI00223DF31F|nr:CCN family member 1 [Pristis pectinata]